MRLPYSKYVAVLAVALLFASGRGEAQKIPQIVIVVQDFQDHPIEGLKIGIEGGGDFRTTGPDGKAILNLAGNTKEGDWVSFQILESPPGKDFVISAPARHRSPVPSQNNKADSFITIVVMPRDMYIAILSSPTMREPTTRIPGPQKKRQ